MPDRSIAHMDLDTFFVSVERLLDSSLNGIPVMVGGEARGVVAACSYEARKYGVHSGMPMHKAKKLCPDAKIVSSGFKNYSHYSQMVTSIIKEAVPLYEKTSIDEFYMDLTGMDRFFGCYKYAKELREKIIKESGLPISFALSTNKIVSKVGSGLAKPNNSIEIKPGDEKAFLAPLNISKLPMLGAKTQVVLNNMGIYTLKDIQETTLISFENTFGKNGKSLWYRANGIDNSEIKPTRERKSMSLERTFNEDSNNITHLHSTINIMVESLAYQLRKSNKMCACVGIKIRYSDFSTYNIQKHIDYSFFDKDLSQCAINLFNALYKSHLKVRLVGLKFSDLIAGGMQYTLFENGDKQLKLHSIKDDIRSKYGKESLKSASNIGSKSMGNINPFNG